MIRSAREWVGVEENGSELVAEGQSECEWESEWESEWGGRGGGEPDIGWRLSRQLRRVTGGDCWVSTKLEGGRRRGRGEKLEEGLVGDRGQAKERLRRKVERRLKGGCAIERSGGPLVRQGSEEKVRESLRQRKGRMEI